MKKLFLFVCCALALDICLADRWWNEKFIIGAHWGPPLQYDEDSLLTRDFGLLKEGGFNFIVGSMNPHNNYSDTLLKYHLDSLIEECQMECQANEMYFLNQPSDSDCNSGIMFGYDIKDEPSIADSLKWLGKVRALRQSNPELLGFVNLLPIHAFTKKDSDNKTIIDYERFSTYINAYLGDSTLQVACFDNYYPNCHFTFLRSPVIANYYSNLAYMKQAAGSRPLWVYLRSSEVYVEKNDSDWQDAYLRVGAFAPLAFGAKGIIYFSYDCKDRNRILRSPGGGAWKGHTMFFDNDEKSRQIFFGNLKYSASPVPDLAIHTNENSGTWYIKESLDSWTENDANKMVRIGTQFGAHTNTIPNIYNWNFTSDGRDKFTTITKDGRLLLSKFRSGWTHIAHMGSFPSVIWSTMNRHTCPFGDFNENQQLDLCIGWTENNQGRIRICMDCQEDAVQDTTTRQTEMSFANTSQVFTFGNPIKQVIARHDSLYVITSVSTDPPIIYDNLYVLKYAGSQFGCVDTCRITLSHAIDHYWMENSLYGQDDDGTVWGAVGGSGYNLTNKITSFSSRELYVWGQYNIRTNKYDRYGIAPDGREYYQTYALLGRKGRPNRIYRTAKSNNKFINDSIGTIVNEGKWLGAYFTSTPQNTITEPLNVIKNDDDNNNPLPLVSRGFAISNCVLLGLYKERNNCNLNLLVINLREIPRDLIFTINQQAEIPQIDEQELPDRYSYICDKITRMFPGENTRTDVYSHYTTIELNNMLGGECAILHLKCVPR